MQSQLTELGKKIQNAKVGIALTAYEGESLDKMSQVI